jgi:hypothetical protein
MERNFKVKWVGADRFIVTSGSGHSMVIDGDKQTSYEIIEADRP